MIERPDFRAAWTEAIELARRANPHYSLSEREQELLFETLLSALPDHPVIVELGVCNGKTAILLAYLARGLGGHYIGVDNWSLEGTYGEVSDHLYNCGFDGYADLLVGSTHDVPLPTMPIDFLLIDAGHQESAVSIDCERWIPRVRPGGLVAFDDYPTEQTWRDNAHWAVHHYADKYTGDWPLVMFWNKVLIRRRPQ